MVARMHVIIKKRWKCVGSFTEVEVSSGCGQTEAVQVEM